MAMKGYFTFPKALGLELHHQMPFYAICMTRVLLGWQMGPWQILTLRGRVALRVMAMKGYFTFPKALGLELHHQMSFYAISMTRVLLGWQTGPWQILTLRGKEDLRVMAIKEYLIFPKAPGFELHYQSVYCHTEDRHWVGLTPLQSCYVRPIIQLLHTVKGFQVLLFNPYNSVSHLFAKFSASYLFAPKV